MSNMISIVEATKSDLPAIVDLLAELVDAVGNSEGSDFRRKIAENCRVLIHDANAHFLVAKVEGTVVGFINFTTRQTALHPGRTGVIDELIVTKSHRGQGMGRRLVSAAIETCRQLGCCELEVSTYKTNTKAKAFYKRCGFEEDAVLLEIGIAW